MVDVRSSRCEYDKCFRHPSFGYKWEKKRRFCGRHKLPDMMDVRSRNQPQVGLLLPLLVVVAWDMSLKFVPLCSTSRAFGTSF